MIKDTAMTINWVSTKQQTALSFEMITIIKHYNGNYPQSPESILNMTLWRRKFERNQNFSKALAIFVQQFDGLVQDCSNFIANALELLHSFTKPSKWFPSNIPTLPNLTCTQNKQIQWSQAYQRLKCWMLFSMVHVAVAIMLIPSLPDDKVSSRSLPTPNLQISRSDFKEMVKYQFAKMKNELSWGLVWALKISDDDNHEIQLNVSQPNWLNP